MTLTPESLLSHIEAGRKPAAEGYAREHAVTCGLVMPAKEDRERMLAAPLYVELPVTAEAWERWAADHMRQARADNPQLDATLSAAEAGDDRRGPAAPEGVVTGSVSR